MKKKLDKLAGDELKAPCKEWLKEIMAAPLDNIPSPEDIGISVNDLDNDVELDEMEEIEKFAENFIKESNYPDKPTPIEIKLYNIKGRDVL